jgi:molybdopterin-guanine dinucleotide biosynthesis protein A
MLVAILVGGAATRMGGIAKGLLPAPDSAEPLVLRLARLASEALPGSEVALIGARTPYLELGMRMIEDVPGQAGPMAGLLAAFAAAHGDVLALACDLPRVSPELVQRVATHAPGAAAVAPRIDGIWQPLFARYDSARALDVAPDARAPWHLLELLGARELPISEGERELLGDWDAPGDVR